MGFLYLQEANVESTPPLVWNIVERQPELELYRKTELSSHPDLAVYVLGGFGQVTRKMGKITQNFQGLAWGVTQPLLP